MDQSQDIHEKNRQLFDLAADLQQCVRMILDEFNKREMRLFNLAAHQRIFLFIITRSFKTFSSILVLCKEGYGQDVSTLLRTLLENLITIRYILHNQKKADQLTKRFVAYKWIILKRYLPEEESQVATASDEERQAFARRKEIILGKVEEFKKEFRVISDRALVTWSGKTVRDMAREADRNLLAEYDKTFRLCSRFSHPSILGDQEYMIQEENFLIFSPAPSGLGIFVNLKSAMRYTLELLKIINGLFSFQYESKLATLESELAQTAQSERAPEEIPLPSKPVGDTHSIRESVVKFNFNTTHSAS